jgi:hypothetical protein
MLILSKQTIRKQNVDPLQPGLGEQNVDPLQPRFREKNVIPSKLRPWEQNVVSLKLKLDESSNLCDSKWIMVTICNSNDKITPNTNWEFRSKNGGLNCFRIYVQYIKCRFQNV